MNDSVYVGNNATNVKDSPKLLGVSKVIFDVGTAADGIVTVEAGNDTGRTVELENPFGSVTGAAKATSNMRYPYQPYEATGVVLNPAAEIGDAVAFTNVYGGIYKRKVNFGRLMKADIAAPLEQEINHEFKFETPSERKISRETIELKASLSFTNEQLTSVFSRVDAIDGENGSIANLQTQISQNAEGISLEATRRISGDNDLSGLITLNANAIRSEVTNRTNADSALSSRIDQTATEISAKVSQTGGNNSSFGWSLLANEFALYSNSKKVFSAKSNGVSVNGTITATSGNVGGWQITDHLLRKYVENQYDVYLQAPNGPIDTNGAFVVRKWDTSTNDWDSKFIVSYGGKMYAKNAEITGKVTASSGAIGGWNIGSTTLSKLVQDTAKQNGYQVYLQAPPDPENGVLGDYGNYGALVVRRQENGAWKYKVVLKYDGSFTANDANISGNINATSGSIGGLSIGKDSQNYSRLSSNDMEWDDNTKTYGVYVGPRGIKLGKNFKVTNTGAVTASNLAINGGSITIGNNFSVNSSGNVTANNMTLTGTLTVGGNQIAAANLYTGAYQAYNNYGNWSDAYASACTSGGYCYGGAGAGYSAYGTWGAAQDSSRGVSSIYAGYLGISGNANISGTTTLNGTLQIWSGGAYRRVYAGTILDKNGEYQNVLRWT